MSFNKSRDPFIPFLGFGLLGKSTIDHYSYTVTAKTLDSDDDAIANTVNHKKDLGIIEQTDVSSN